MNLRQLTYFMKVVETGSITSASQQLYVAQPALGLQIRQIESDLGVALLVRHSRGVSATEAGRLLYERARTIVQLIEETRREVMTLNDEKRETIALGLTPSIMSQVGPDLLTDAQEREPQIFISLVEEMSFMLVDALERGEIDIALAYDVPDRPTLIREPLLEEEILFISGPATNAGNEPAITLAAALRHDLVQAGERDAVRRLVQSEGERRGLTMQIAFEAQSISLMKAMVARGEVASFMPFGTTIQELRTGALVARRVVEPTLRRTLYLVRSAKRPRFRHQEALNEILRSTQERLAASLGSLAACIGETRRADVRISVPQIGFIGNRPASANLPSSGILRT